MNKKATCVVCAAVIAVFAFCSVSVTHAQDVTPPTVPTNIAATLTQSGQVYVSWNGSTDNIGVEGYYLYRDGQLVANTPGLLFYTDNAPAGTHTYTAAAYDAAGNVSAQSLPSTPLTVIADTIPPSQPSSFVLTPSSSSIALSWTASTDNVAVIGYYIYRNGQKLDLSNIISGTTYTDIGLSPGVVYTYQVGAYDAAGNITRSIPISVSTIFDVTPPSPPYSLKAIGVSTGEIDLSWNPATDNVAVANYQIYRDGSYVGSTNGTSTAYADAGLSPNTEYSYWVVTVDEVGNVSIDSIPSSAMTLPPDLTPPSIPTGLHFVSPSTSEIDFSWMPSTDNVGVVGYYIFRNGNQIASVASTTYIDVGLATNTTYMYAVRAYDAAGNISPQQSIGATTLAVNPIVSIATSSPTGQQQQAQQQQQSQSQQSTATALPASGYTFTITLTVGSRGTPVQNLQLVLIQQGDLAAGYATGYFGSLTQKAVQQLQCSKGIVCSGSPRTTGWGTVGPKTRSLLNTLD